MMAFSYDSPSTALPVRVINVTVSTAVQDWWEWAWNEPTYVGAAWVRPAKPAKNWRWFHIFSPVLIDLHWLGDACWPVRPLLRRLLMRDPTQVRRHKRKQLVQRMREASA